VIELDIFSEWIRRKVDDNKTIIVNCKIQEWRNTDKPSLTFSLTTTDGWLGCISFWNSGESDMFIFDKNANIVLPVTYTLIASPDEFDAAFEGFFQKLINRE
jgi:hypothetical protein